MAKFYVENNVLRVEELAPGSAADALEKWRSLHELCQQGYLVHDGGIKTCAFCQVYFAVPPAGDHDNCKGCPIAKFTGRPVCFGTSYDNYTAALHEDDVEAATEASGNMVDLLEKLASRGNGPGGQEEPR